MFKRISCFWVSAMVVMFLIISGAGIQDKAAAAELILVAPGPATALTVSGEDVYIQHDFAPNETPVCDLVDKEGYLLGDGYYKYELRTIPITDQAAVKKAYEAGDEVALAAIHQVEDAQVKVQSGSFKIVDGVVVLHECPQNPRP